MGCKVTCPLSATMTAASSKTSFRMDMSTTTTQWCSKALSNNKSKDLHSTCFNRTACSSAAHSHLKNNFWYSGWVMELTCLTIRDSMQKRKSVQTFLRRTAITKEASAWYKSGGWVRVRFRSRKGVTNSMSSMLTTLWGATWATRFKRKRSSN